MPLSCPADAAPMPLRHQQPARSRPRSKTLPHWMTSSSRASAHVLRSRCHPPGDPQDITGDGGMRFGSTAAVRAGRRQYQHCPSKPTTCNVQSIISSVPHPDLDRREIVCLLGQRALRTQPLFAHVLRKITCRGRRPANEPATAQFRTLTLTTGRPRNRWERAIGSSWRHSRGFLLRLVETHLRIPNGPL